MMSYLRARGTGIVDGKGKPVTLKGFGLGGWMNMENFITGYPYVESFFRRETPFRKNDFRIQ